MANIRVGDPEFLFSELVTLIRCSPVAAEMLFNWTVLADALGNDHVRRKKHKLDLLHEILTHADVIKEVFIEWRSTKAMAATLGNLVDILEEKCKWNDLAEPGIGLSSITEVLLDIIKEKAKKWDDLHGKHKMILLKSPVKFLNRTLSLHEIKNTLGDDKLNKILQDFLQRDVMRVAMQGNGWSLRKVKEDHEKLQWYIPRTLTLQRKLEVKIFREDSLDVFVFEGLKWIQLHKLAKPAKIDKSGFQVDGITVRFIFLECPEDFESLRQNWREKDAPLHRIKCADGAYLWDCTVGSVDLIQKHLIDTPEEIREAQMVEETLTNFNSRPIAVADIPGMGKTWLLSQISRLVQNHYPDRYILYLSLPKLFTSGESHEEDPAFLTMDKIKRMLSKEATNCPLGEEILVALMNCKLVKFELFLDSFDEIPSSQIPLAKRMLELLLKSNNLRAFITTRTHMRDNLQQTIGVISWNIKPFTEVDQTHYFIRYWTDVIQTENPARVTEFAESCVKYFRSSDAINNDVIGDNDIACVPLHCSMLAEVYTKDATRHVNGNSTKFEITCKLSTLEELYKEFMNRKFGKVRGERREVVKMAHFLVAIRYQFKEWAEKLEDMLKEEEAGAGGLDPKELLSAGILKSVNPPKFVHRTFSEYLVADFVVSRARMEQPQQKSPEFAQFLFEAILASTKTAYGARITPSLQDPIIHEFVTVLQSSPIWPCIGEEFKRMVVALSMQNIYSEIVYENERDIPFVLSKWATTNGDTATYQRLIKVLNSELHWPADVIEQLLKVPSSLKMGYLHVTICTFIDALLNNKGKTINLQKDYPGLFKSSLEYYQPHLMQPLCAATFFENSVKCTVRGLGNLFRMLRAISIHTVNYRDLLNYRWTTLAVEAAGQDLSVFEAVIEFIESLYGKTLFELDFDLSKWGEYIVTPLHEAVAKGDERIVTHIITTYEDSLNLQGLLVHICSFSAKQPRAFVNKKRELIQLLVDSEIDVCLNETVTVREEEVVKQVSPVTAQGIHIKLFKLLVELGAETGESFDIDGFIYRVLLFLTSEDIDELVDFLVDKGLLGLLIRPNANGFTCLKFGVLWDVIKPETFERILASHKISLGDLGDSGRIFRAVGRSNRNPQMLESFMKLFGSVNFSYEDGTTLLMLAAASRSPVIVKHLISAGANVNAMSKGGETPLTAALNTEDNCASRPGWIHECVELLLEGGADVNAKDSEGNTVMGKIKHLDPAGSLQKETLDLLITKLEKKPRYE